MKAPPISGLLIALAWLCLLSCNGQANNNRKEQQVAGGGCDGCALMYEDMPQAIPATDTSTGWREPGRKLLLTGIAYQQDGSTPAQDVIIYYWQTDNNGYYKPDANTPAKARRHGHIRGWVKTDKKGRYAIYTIRPKAYPDGSEPEHIHIAIKEPAIPDEYYTDELVFDDDPLLIPYLKKRQPENRGGSGILRVVYKDGLQIAEHNFILGLNIPYYPQAVMGSSDRASGLAIGEDQPSLMPVHVFGPDKGSTVCPVCKYGRYHGLLYFVGNHPDWDAIKKWLGFLEEQANKRQKYLKVYFVYGNTHDYSSENRQKELENTGRLLNLKNTALTYVPSFKDTQSEVHLNRINPEVKSTFVIYRFRNIIAKYTDLEPTAGNFRLISSVLDHTQSAYRDLPEPEHD